MLQSKYPYRRGTWTVSELEPLKTVSAVFATEECRWNIGATEFVVADLKAFRHTM